MELWAIICLSGVGLLLGATVQGTIGLGLALVASPLVTLLDPSLMPGMMIVCSCFLPALTLVNEHHDIDWKGLAWAFPWRFVGTAIGAWLVVIASPVTLAIVVGVVVLAAVVLSLVKWRPHPSPTALSIGALVSGIGGTATSIGGPPIALVYQHQSPSRLRCTLGVYFLVGNAVSLATLALVGKLTAHQLGVGVLMIPFMIAGFGLSLLLRGRVDQAKVRTGVLVISAISSIILIVRAIG